ncbi:MAG: 30S ribosomal protein S16 [Melioribacteraceae bacterium]|nr:30S ribosomal protein S16 [Melioribacteraceae bacterium]MCF8356695.1 30S ribosomal protein S16 [Melioribacteraceae bacterium]MCF8393867.1 30S ribosomal protein S16 [Melioribacteraceae bacterium]MCF8418240.1 30S ribosomal protein S16 [Melioribacteraceae bacterium]
MAVKLRLRRMGKKKQPVYKVVAADVRSPRDGKFIEAIGLYNPRTNPATIEIQEDRALYWLSVGAQPTDTVKNLLSSLGIILKKELTNRGLTEDQVEAQLNEWKKQKEAKLNSVKKDAVKSENKDEKKEEKPEEKAVENTEEVKPEAKNEDEKKVEVTEEKVSEEEKDTASEEKQDGEKKAE